ncbi:MAG: FHA domain-containing protein, partial [Rudaea sp.]
PAQPPAATAAPASGYALRHILSGQPIPLDPARSEFLVGRPDPATGSQPEIDLGPYDQNRNLSRRHARILYRDGVYCVREDSGTTNGTYVNGERLQTGVEVALKPGDKLRFGSIEVEFVSL